MTRTEGDLPQLGHSLYGQAGLCTAPSWRVAGEDQRTGRAPAGGVLLPTAGCPEVVAAASAAGVVGGEQETPGLETALSDSLDRSDSGGGVTGHPTDPAPLSHQATTVDLQRFGHRDPQQCRSLLGRWAAARSKKPVSIRGLNENHNHDLKNLFKGAAIVASSKPGPFRQFFTALLAKGMRPEMARLTLARKIATIVLIVWKNRAGVLLYCRRSGSHVLDLDLFEFFFQPIDSCVEL